MKRKLILLTVLVSAILGWLPTAQAHEDVCRPIDIRLGHFDKPACQLDPEEVLRAIELHKARQQAPVRWVPPPPPKKPNLQVLDMNEGYGLGNAVMSARARVKNDGNADARNFRIEFKAEFVRLDTGELIHEGPITIRMSYLAAGDRAWSEWLFSELLEIPDPYYDYVVLFVALVDAIVRIDGGDQGDIV
ncbi:MAG: hypothetical protein AAGE43_12370, partial [Pseudomonadota bacterium]